MDDGSELLSRIRVLASDAPGTMRSIAEFLLMEGSELANTDMGQVAQASYTSKASLVRFAKHLGFDGWVSFRRAFIEEVRGFESSRFEPGTIDVNFPFNASDTPLSALDKTIRAKEQGVRHALKGLTNEALCEAARTIMGAATFGIFAKDPGRSLGTAFAYNMRLIGRRCIVPHTEESEYVARGLGQGDCALFISYTGRVAGEPVSHVRAVREHGASVVCITNTNGVLAQFSDIALTFEGEEHFFNKMGGFYSCSAMECLLDALYVACYLEHSDDNLSSRARYSEDLAKRFSTPSALV